MNKDLLQQRVQDLRKAVEQGACEFNKLLGRLEEATMHLQYALDKEAQAARDAAQVERDALEQKNIEDVLQ